MRAVGVWVRYAREARGRPRALNRELRIPVRDVAHFGVEVIVGYDPREVFFGVRGVDTEKIVALAESVEDAVVHRASLGAHQRCVLGLKVLEARGIVRGDELDESQRLAATDFDLSHVADVEKSGGCADTHVLGDDA